MIFRLKLEVDELVSQMIGKIPEHLFKSSSTKFLDPSIGGGQFIKVIEQKLRENGHSDSNIKNRVFGVEKSLLRVNFAVNKHNLKGTYVVDTNDVPDIFTNMKFDCIVGNPPYQKQVGPSKSEPMWHIFVEKSIQSLNDGGYLCIVHPSGWRNVGGRFTEISNLIKSKDVKYLEVHSVDDGIKTFGATITYDWYVLKNAPSTKSTIVNFKDGERTIDLTSIPFIPTGEYDKVMSLLAKNGEEKCKLIYDRSKYGTDKPNMSREKVGEFKYPCVYSINAKEVPTFWYSNVKGDHFGVSKFIIPSGDVRSIGFIEDCDGKYGLTQFAIAIEESDSNILKKYHECFLSKNFAKFYSAYLCIGKTQYNYRLLSMFKKDFWKEFI